VPLRSCRNLVLAALEPVAREAFAARLHKVELVKGDILQEPGEAVQWVYFPESGLIAVLAETLAGETVESSMVGWDGALGVFEACGSRKHFARAIIQVPGTAWRIRAASYRDLFAASEGLREAVHKNVEITLAESRQFVACNALHNVDSRLSRSILDALERSGQTHRLPLTQEAMALMLGVQRTTVAVSASALQRQGMIRNVRGAIEVLDRPGLERTACTCRKIIAYVRGEILACKTEVCDASP
jgi:CRP-like cAMP-binding protein